MSLDLDQLQELADAATPGSWICVGNGGRDGHACLVPAGLPGEIADGLTRADAAFIAAARTAVPALIARVRELEAERDHWRFEATELAALRKLDIAEGAHQRQERDRLATENAQLRGALEGLVEAEGRIEESEGPNPFTPFKTALAAARRALAGTPGEPRP